MYILCCLSSLGLNSLTVLDTVNIHIKKFKPKLLSIPFLFGFKISIKAIPLYKTEKGREETKKVKEKGIKEGRKNKEIEL